MADLVTKPCELAGQEADSPIHFRLSKADHFRFVFGLLALLGLGIGASEQ